MEANFLSENTRAGIAVTNASGIANVVFRNQLPNNVSYVVMLTCVDVGQAVIAYPSNITQTGFTITSKDTQKGGGGYAIVGATTVHWLIIPQSN
jgi:hypothetical protein